MRVELVAGDGEPLSVRPAPDEAAPLELERGEIVFVRPTRQLSFGRATGVSGVVAR